MSKTAQLLTTKRLMEYLPGIYREDPSGQGVLSRFLFAFEALLLDVGHDKLGLEFNVEPLEKKISDLPQIFNPEHTPEEFLPWLASWAALTFRFELNSAQRRKLLSHIIP